MAQTVRNPPAMREIWAQSLGWEDPLENRMATQSSILAWRIPWTEEPGGLQSTESQRVRQDWETNTSLFTHGNLEGYREKYPPFMDEGSGSIFLSFTCLREKVVLSSPRSTLHLWPFWKIFVYLFGGIGILNAHCGIFCCGTWGL